MSEELPKEGVAIVVDCLRPVSVDPAKSKHCIREVEKMNTTGIVVALG